MLFSPDTILECFHAPDMIMKQWLPVCQPGLLVRRMARAASVNGGAEKQF
jgi:hypothetical protein